MANTNRMKALYAIVLPKTSAKGEADRAAQDTNEERLNDNFRTIANELIKLWERGEHSLNLLSARISSDEQVYLTEPDVNGIVANAIANNATILMLPDNIMSQVTQIINGFLPDDQGGSTVEEALASLLSQESTNITATFTQAISNTNGQIENLTSWVRVYGVGNGITAPGVVIGDSSSSSSFKAESSYVYFYRGDDTQANIANADVSLGADGSLNAKSVRSDSFTLQSMFDIDVVTAGGIDYLHITGRN